MLLLLFLAVLGVHYGLSQPGSIHEFSMFTGDFEALLGVSFQECLVYILYFLSGLHAILPSSRLFKNSTAAYLYGISAAIAGSVYLLAIAPWTFILLPCITLSLGLVILASELTGLAQIYFWSLHTARFLRTLLVVTANFIFWDWAQTLLELPVYQVAVIDTATTIMACVCTFLPVNNVSSEFDWAYVVRDVEVIGNSLAQKASCSQFSWLTMLVLCLSHRTWDLANRMASLQDTLMVAVQIFSSHFGNLRSRVEIMETRLSDRQAKLRSRLSARRFRRSKPPHFKGGLVATRTDITSLRKSEATTRSVVSKLLARIEELETAVTKAQNNAVAAQNIANTSHQVAAAAERAATSARATSDAAQHTANTASTLAATANSHAADARESAVEAQQSANHAAVEANSAQAQQNALSARRDSKTAEPESPPQTPSQPRALKPVSPEVTPAVKPVDAIAGWKNFSVTAPKIKKPTASSGPAAPSPVPASVTVCTPLPAAAPVLETSVVDKAIADAAKALEIASGLKVDVDSLRKRVNVDYKIRVFSLETFEARTKSRLSTIEKELGEKQEHVVPFSDSDNSDSDDGDDDDDDDDDADDNDGGDEGFRHQSQGEDEEQHDAEEEKGDPAPEPAEEPAGEVVKDPSVVEEVREEGVVIGDEEGDLTPEQVERPASEDEEDLVSPREGDEGGEDNEAEVPASGPSRRRLAQRNRKKVKKQLVRDHKVLKKMFPAILKAPQL